MHSEKNQRSAMEDRSQAVDLTGSEAFPGAGRAGFFAVFDGHAGHEAAQYLADHMLGYVLAAGPGALTDNPLAVLGDAVQRAESELVAGNRCAGSTLCALLLVDDKLHVAHVGDSRAVLGRGTEARQLTRDHKPLCRIEAARVAADDPAAEISSDGYIYGEFAVTRAIGSAHFKLDPSKRALIARPDLTTVQLAPEDDFIVVASDGVWDVLPNAEAVSATRRALASVRDAAAAARSLVDRAQRRASSDNISVIMLLLHSRAISMPKSNSMLFRRSQLSSMAAAAGGGGGGGGTGSGGDSPRSYSSTAPCSGTSTPLNMTPRSSTPVLGGTPVRERDGGSGIEPSPAAAAAVAASSPVPAGR
jgi:protein phosphatase 2C family protein 2/3